MAEVIEGVVLPLTDRTIDLIVDAMSAEQMAAALKVALKERRDVESRPPDVTVTMLEAPRPGERVQSVCHEVPVVQFRSLDDFIVDLSEGRVIAAYHDMASRPVRWWQTVVRALVVRGGDLHVASLTVALSELRFVDARGEWRHATDDEHQTAAHERLVADIRERLEEIGVVSFQGGVIAVSNNIQVVYAGHPEVLTRVVVME